MKRNRSLTAVGIVVLLLILGSVAHAALSGMENRMSADDYHYNPAGKKDPFQSFVEKELLFKKKAQRAVAVSIFPLQRASIDQFILVGIAGDAKRRLAIMETKGGKGRHYTLELGTIIGLNNGKVVEIMKDMIVVEETFLDRAGRMKVNRIMKKLHRDEEDITP
jgi:type IV pilus assembly protein PilP